MIDIQQSYRSRFVLEVAADLPQETEQYNEHALRFIPLNPPGWLAEVYWPITSDHSIEDAHVKNRAVMDEVLDRISLIGFCYARIREVVSTCPSAVNAGQEFKVVTETVMTNRSPARISWSDLTGVNPPNPATKHASSVLRSALNAETVEERLLRLYSTLERIAAAETTERHTFPCPHCKVDIDQGPATAWQIRSILKGLGIGSDRFKTLRSMRGKVAHGQISRSAAEVSALVQAIADLEPAAVAAVAFRSSAHLQQTAAIYYDTPLMIWDFEMTEHGPQMRETRWVTKSKVGTVPGSWEPRDPGGMSIGVPFGPSGHPMLHPAALPDLIR